MGFEKKLHVVLMHHPVKGRYGEVITSAVTNLDIHDLARLCRTYGVKNFFIVNPDKRQKEISKDIVNHWTQGYGANYNSLRKEALNSVKIVDSLDEVKDRLGDKNRVLLIVTSADKKENTISFEHLKEMLEEKENDFLLLLGTSWGLADEIVKQADFTLEPIDMDKGYNHLSVRSAASIIMDRLLN